MCCYCCQEKLAAEKQFGFLLPVFHVGSDLCFFFGSRVLKDIINKVINETGPS